MFPARAGMSRPRRRSWMSGLDVPRVSGDEPKWDDKMKDVNECSL